MKILIDKPICEIHKSKIRTNLLVLIPPPLFFLKEYFIMFLVPTSLPICEFDFQ